MAKGDHDFVYITYIKTTPEKLWDALTNPEFTRQYWFGIDVTSDWKVGSSMTFLKEGKTLVDGKVLAAERPKLLAYTFHESNGDASAEPPTKVTLEIQPETKDTVKLTVIHTDFVANSKHRPSISQGWPAVLSAVKSLLETGRGVDFESFKPSSV